MKHFSLTFLAMLALIWSCGQETTTQQNFAEASAEEAAEIVPLGARAATMLMDSLKLALSTAIQAEGPAYAIDICNLQAMPLTAKIAQSLPGEVQIKRTSFRYRNPANAPDDIEAAALNYFAAKAEAGAELPGQYVQKVNENGAVYFNYYQPLRTAGLCLTCHGDRETMDANLKAALAARYPQDLATGYGEGDFRGVIKVQIKPESDQL